MTDLSVAPVSATPEVAHILDEIFTLCRIPFVHDFMFTADPVADISILTAPVQKEHAIAARITVSGTETSPSFAHVFDFSCDFFFCSIPAFSVGAITVGFATQEPARDPSHANLHALPAAAERVQCNRYVRDDERGIFFMLSESASTGITEVDCMSHRSTRRRTRVCARFHTETLRVRLRSPRGVLHPDDLAAALTYLNVSYERRACPICKANDKGECGCTLPFCRPAHPLDFRNERRNMRLHTGLYQGGCTVRLFNAAMPFVVTNLSTTSIIKGSLDGKVINRLNKYAVQDRMGKLKLDPLGLSICAAGESVVGDSESRLESRTRNAEAVVDVTNEATMLPDASFLQDNGGLKSPSLSTFSLGLLTDGPVPLVAAPLGTGTTLIDGICAGQGRSADPSSSHSQNEGDAEARSTSSVEHSQAASVSQDAGASAGGSRSRSRSRGETSQCGADGGDADADDGGSAVRKATVLKAELRKRRNREAAARSNVKRKIRNEKLRRDLADVSRRAAELRAMEKVLREENVRLRGLATQRQFNVSAHLTHIQIARS